MMNVTSASVQKLTATRRTYLGLGSITLATLLYEVLLTRIFSVVAFYHFAFVAISVAVFGMTVGALSVYLSADRFPLAHTHRQLSLSALLFSLSVITALALQLILSSTTGLSPLLFLVMSFVLTAIPFFWSGVCVAIALTRFPRNVSALYAVDLIGAALGAIAFIVVIGLTDAPTAVLAVALLAATSARLFAGDTSSAPPRRAATLTVVIVLIIVATNGILATQQRPILRFAYAKGEVEKRPLYEKWNAYSRIRIIPKEGEPEPIERLELTIDSSAATVLTRYDGKNVDPLRYLRGDVTNVAHALRPNASVLVVGSGGGQDVLSALVFGQRAVTAVEINATIVDAVNRRFGDFTGHLDRDPRVRFIVDEARAFTASSREHYDIIQVSFIDTWAASSAGAFALTENSLYTVEGWRTFLEHLSPRGILTVSRWYFTRRPDEMYRLTSLARVALEEIGVEDPRSHILILRSLPQDQQGMSAEGIGTLMISRDPFSPQDVATTTAVAEDNGFDLVLTPTETIDPAFAALASAETAPAFIASAAADLSAPTDDRPFFFNMLRIRDAFRTSLFSSYGNRDNMAANMAAVTILISLLLFITVLTVLSIFLPLARVTRRAALRGSHWYLLFFIGIGFGFMFIELAQMQRLTIFLGHPTAGLTVVLFTLLIASGIGSFTTHRIVPERAAVSAAQRLLVLIGVLVAVSASTGVVITSLAGASLVARSSAAIALLAPAGFFMGMAFPLGLRAASTRFAGALPWFWGVNGATSVLATVIAMVLTMGVGIRFTFGSGIAAYVIALIAALFMARRHRERLLD